MNSSATRTRIIIIVFDIRESYESAADPPKHPQTTNEQTNKGNQNEEETHARRLRSSLLLPCLPPDNVLSIA